MFFEYTQESVDHLCARDSLLGAAIERIGRIERAVSADIFSSIVHHIVGQQISTVAQETIWNRLMDGLGVVTAHTLCQSSREHLQSFGLSFRKVDYIQDFARKVTCGAFVPAKLQHMSDSAVIETLCELKGIGVWTAEMLLLFCLQRPNVLSFGDLAIQRGLRMLYGHESISKELFAQYVQRYSPYASVASLYIWAIAGGALPELHDPAVQSVQVKKPAPKGKEPAPKKHTGKKQEEGIFAAQYMSPHGIMIVGYTTSHIKTIKRLHEGMQLSENHDALPSHVSELFVQLDEYFAGKRQFFEVPLQLQGTEFQKRVWQALCDIPYGETRSYQDIARVVGNEKACRAVGLANNKNPVSIVVPCHRVIGKNGTLTGYAGGVAMKESLLELEKRVLALVQE